MQYSPIISPNEFQYVHHILAYLCNSLSQDDVGASAPCNGPVSSSVSDCLAGELIAGWAVGGNVSYSTGGKQFCVCVCVCVCVHNNVLPKTT